MVISIYMRAACLILKDLRRKESQMDAEWITRAENLKSRECAPLNSHRFKNPKIDLSYLLD